MDDERQMHFPSDRHILLGAGRGEGQVCVVDEMGFMRVHPVKSVVKDKTAGKGYAIEASIPFSFLNVAEAKAGREFLFNMSVNDSEGDDRARQYMWSGDMDAGNNRREWGRLRLE